MKIRTLLFHILFHLIRINGQKVGCGDEYNTTSWNCDKLMHFFSPSNLERTLYCIGYNKLIPNTPCKDDCIASKKPFIKINRWIHSFEKVDEENNLVTFDEILTFMYDTKQLELFIADCPTHIDIPIKFIPYFIPNAFLGDGIKNQDITDMRLIPRSGWIILNGRRLTKEPCTIDLKNYPFDEHDCEIKLTLRLQTDHVTLSSNSHQSLLESNDSLLNPGWNIEASNISIKPMKGHFKAWSFTLKMKRNVTSILMHFYLPSIILCFASMMSLFIHHDLLPARMCLSVTSCLSLITLIMGAK